MLTAAAALGLMWSEAEEPSTAPIVAEPVQQKAEAGIGRQKVYTVRGAKLANSDKQVTNPFRVEHLTEAQEREQGLVGNSRGKPGIIGTDPTKAINSEAQRASAGKEESAKQGGDHVEENVSPAESIKLVGVMCSNDRSMAIISVDGRQFSMAVGEQTEGVELLSLDSNSAVVRDACGLVHNLNL